MQQSIYSEPYAVQFIEIGPFGCTSIPLLLSTLIRLACMYVYMQIEKSSRGIHWVSQESEEGLRMCESAKYLSRFLMSRSWKISLTSVATIFNDKSSF